MRVSNTNDIIVVSGLPRSGTSMMMRMLASGGIDLVTDAIRGADADNPHGYFEYEAVKRLRDDAVWLTAAQGKAIKVISPLLRDLPTAYCYRVIFLHRPLEEVLASQRAMLLRRVELGQVEPHCVTTDVLDSQDDQLRGVYHKHLHQIRLWLDSVPYMTPLHVNHRTILEQPADSASLVAHFLGRPLNEQAMAKAVEPGLYRQRHP